MTASPPALPVRVFLVTSQSIMTSGSASLTHGTSAGADASRPPSSGPYRLLIVDDDPDIVLALETYFKEEGFEVESAQDGARALEKMSQDPGFDLVVLDVVLPGMNGFDVLEKSHERGLTSPVLMMSGRGDQENILKGFGLGAEDYIVKPFEPDELYARTVALVGRLHRTDALPSRHMIGERTIDFEVGSITWDGGSYDISEMELDILRCLVENLGCVVTKRRLLREAWQIDDHLIAHTIDPDIAIDRIDRSVNSLRGKLEPAPSKPEYIHTVYGLGYRLSA